MAHDIFISYAEEDNLAAKITCNSLESEGISCWIALRDIGAGAKWEQAIMDAISASRVMVLVFSEDANRSDHVQREVGSAFANGITVVPFRIRNAKPTGILDYYLRPVQWIDAFTLSLEEHSKSLAVKVKDILPGNEMDVAKSGPMTIFRDRERNLVICLDVPTGDGLDYSGKLTARLDLGLTKGLIGPRANPSGQRGFGNDENTLFGISHQPCTKASYTHFFVITHGNFISINDVNSQVARFLNEPFATSAIYFLRIESISGTTVKLQTVDFRAEWLPYPEKELLVNVDGNGTITLIR
jgi:TIR domain